MPPSRVVEHGPPVMAPEAEPLESPVRDWWFRVSVSVELQGPDVRAPGTREEGPQR